MYRPRNVPTSPADLPAFLSQEMLNLQKALSGPEDIRMYNVLHAPPEKTIRGMDVYADGVDWNPGSGEGRYYFNGTVWKFLG